MVRGGRPAPRGARHSRTLSRPFPHPIPSIPAPILSFSCTHPVIPAPILSFPRRRESSTLRPARVYQDTTRAKENGTSNAVLFYKC